MVKIVKAAFAYIAVQYMVPVESVSFNPILPPSYPLAVRNPYLSAWLPGNQTKDISTAQPQFWSGNDLSWSVIARVEGKTYNLFGGTTNTSSSTAVSLLNATYSSTHTLFTVSAANVTFALDFFSPVSFSSYVRQSLPFSYLSVTVAANGETSPTVDIYSAIDERWTGQTEATECTFNTSARALIHQLSANGATYSQSADEIALWGKVIYAADNQSNLFITSGSGSAETLHEQFQANGTLSSNQDGFCQENGFHGFAFQLGNVSQETTVRFAIGVVREAAINYFGTSETHFYRARFPDVSSAVDHFFDDYDDAADEGHRLDVSIRTTATSLAGSNYSDILALSTRQVFGAIDVTIPSDTLDTDDVKAFIKEISSDGNLNTVDIIYPTFPFFYVFAPTYLRLLLDPVLQYLETGRYPHPYAVHDLGSNYPNSTGHDDGNDEQMPIEETGNILILISAYEQATGDTTWAGIHSDLLRQYAIYLQENGLYPVWQLSTTDGLGAFANMTSLGIKAAVGLSAYGQISGQQNWTDLGSSFAETISTTGVGTYLSSTTNQPYFDLAYGDETWYLTFNIYPSALLNLTTFNQSTYDAQSDFYPTIRSTGGVAIDGNVEWGKTDWDVWVAALSDEGTRDMFINDIHAYLANGKNTQPFSDRYWTSGDEEGLAVFRARPTVGAHWAIWALEKGPNSGGL